MWQLLVKVWIFSFFFLQLNPFRQKHILIHTVIAGKWNASCDMGMETQVCSCVCDYQNHLCCCLWGSTKSHLLPVRNGCRHHCRCKKLGITLFSACYYYHGDYSNSVPFVDKDALIEMEHKSTSFENSQWSWALQNDYGFAYNLYSSIIVFYEFIIFGCVILKKNMSFVKVIVQASILLTRTFINLFET